MSIQEKRIDESYYLFCRVCGIEQDYPPWGEDGNTPSSDICFCCGSEFGYDDCNLTATRRSRERWIKGGYTWFHKEFKPENWDPVEQMKNIPPEFR